MCPKCVLICGEMMAKPAPSSAEPAAEASRAAETQPGPVLAPGQLADEHGAQAEHADRAQQGHG